MAEDFDAMGYPWCQQCRGCGTQGGDEDGEAVVCGWCNGTGYTLRAERPMVEPFWHVKRYVVGTSRERMLRYPRPPMHADEVWPSIPTTVRAWIDETLVCLRDRELAEDEPAPSDPCARRFRDDGQGDPLTYWCDHTCEPPRPVVLNYSAPLFTSEEAERHVLDLIERSVARGR